MPHSGLEPLELQVESQDLVLRGLSGEELDPAVLNGQVVLNLSEATTLKEIQLTFNGLAKVSWRDTTTHHHDHPLFFHDFNFLNPHANPHNKKEVHSHTLKAGRHVFPFTIHVPGSLPASIRTYSGTCVSEYKLKAVAMRSGFGADWKARKVIRIARGFGVDAVEYNQTMEIENTWPGKVMYAFTLPHKAYAAGDTIPVSVKFSPLAKGVRIVSLITTIREHTTVHSKNSQHSEARDATVVKYNFDDPSSSASGSTTPAHQLHQPPRIESSASLSSMSGHSTPTTPGPGQSHAHPHVNGDGFPLPHQPLPSRLHRLLHSALAGEGEGEVSTGTGDEEEEIDDGMDTEVDVVVEVPIPIWTAPTHTVHPVFINHKIKWSAFIKNPDGHVSELRCALPIHILASSLSEEARLASAGSRNLLFGESGVLAHSDVPQVDLPSYQDHVMDRVANAETASYFSLAAGFAPTPWSQPRTPGGGTPHSSPPPSRPSSPGPSRNTSSMALSSFVPIQTPSGTRSGRTSGTATPITSPQSPSGMIDPEHPDNHANWIDSELLSTLNLDHTSPPGSNPASRPGSRPNSRPASPVHFSRGEAGGSGDVSHSSSEAQLSSSVQSHHFDPPPSLHRSSTSGSGFFHLHIPKPLRPLTSFSRNGSSASLSALTGGSSSGSSSHLSSHPSASALTNALEAHAAKNRHHGERGNPNEVITHQAMSNSPIHSTNQSATTSPLSSSPATGSGHASGSLSHIPSSSALATPGLHTPSPGHHHYTPPATVGPNGEDIDLLSQVPSYDVAARGFLGGGAPPLSVSSTLPGYED